MANNYFNTGGTPSQGSGLNSVNMRNEFAFIEDGFDKLPVLTGNASKAVRVNSTETGLEAFNSAAVTEVLTGKTIDLTDNTVTGTLAEFNTACSDANFASLAGAEALTNKTLSTGTVVSAEVTNTATSAFQVPVGTDAQRPTAATGKIRYNSTISKFEGYGGSAWSSLGGGATGAGADEIFVQNGQTVTQSYTIPTGKNAHSVGAITIADGVTVTLSDGSRWVVS